MISANTPSTSVNRARVLDTAAAWICPTVTRACAVRDDERCTVRNTNRVSCIEPGWTGFDCSEDIDECSVKRPCREARVCLNQPGSYKCDCLENFIGQNCETVRTMGNSENAIRDKGFNRPDSSISNRMQKGVLVRITRDDLISLGKCRVCFPARTTDGRMI